MTKEEFLLRLQDIENQLCELYLDNRVLPDSAIYTYMYRASILVCSAMVHIDELREDMYPESNTNNQN